MVAVIECELRTVDAGLADSQLDDALVGLAAASLTAIGLKPRHDDANSPASVARLANGTKYHVAETTPVVEHAAEIFGRRHAGDVLVFEAPLLFRQIAALRRRRDIMKERFHHRLTFFSSCVPIDG